MCYVDITSAGVVSLCSLPSFLSPAPSLVQLTELGRCSTPAPAIVIVRYYLAQWPHSPGSRSDVVLSGNNPVILLSPVTDDFFHDANDQDITELIGI